MEAGLHLDSYNRDLDTIYRHKDHGTRDASKEVEFFYMNFYR
jgi:hypothetical protein